MSFLNIPGFLGSRASILMDTILVVILLLPFILIWSIGLVRKGQHELHKQVQAILLCAVLIAVIIFELQIRLSGGSGSLIKGSRFADNVYFLTLLYSHIAISVWTFTLWTGNILHANIQWKNKTLPGQARIRHRLIGKIIFIGTCLTAISGFAVYLFAFVF
jgi:uncharacterized membrane protein YozB (DUF420 family)